MRILHVVDNYPPSRGGMERAVQALARSQAAAGHDVRVVALATPTLPTETTDGDVRVYRLEGYTRLLRPFLADPEQQFHPTIADRALVRRIAALLEQEPADVIHAHGWIVHSAMALPRDPDTALVHTLHDYGLTCATKTMIRDQRPGSTCAGASVSRCLPCSTGFYGAIKGTALAAGALSAGRVGRRGRFPAVDLFLPISAAVAAASLDGVEEERVRVVPSTVPDDVARAAGERPPFLPPGDFLLFVGQLGPHKGIDVLLDAHRRIDTALPLVVVGPSRADTPDLTGSADRPVIRLSDLDHATIMACFAAATMTVVPSRWAEPLGLVAVESMVVGTPVIVSDIGGLSEIVDDGRAGIAVPPGRADLLASAIDGLLADAPRRARLGERGRERAADFTSSAVLPAVIDAYEEALRARARVTPSRAGEGDLPSPALAAQPSMRSTA